MNNDSKKKQIYSTQHRLNHREIRQALTNKENMLKNVKIEESKNSIIVYNLPLYYKGQLNRWNGKYNNGVWTFDITKKSLLENWLNTMIKSTQDARENVTHNITIK